MARRKKQTREENPAAESPVLEQTDWDALAGDSFAADRKLDDTDLPYYVEVDSDASAPEEDDNAYQNSDEALPDDEDERVLARNPSKPRVRFNGV